MRTTQPSSQLNSADIVPFPGTFRFGADQDLTVITVYLQETKKLRSLAQEQYNADYEGHPIAYIVAYDLKYAQITLLCVSDAHRQHRIPLDDTSASVIYRTIQKTTQREFSAQPEDILNAIRQKANMPKIQYAYQPFDKGICQ